MKTDFVSHFVVLLVCAGYGATAWLMQMYRVVAPRDWLQERLLDLSTRIATEDEQRDLRKLESRLGRSWLPVPASRVNAGWRHAHALEDAHVLRLPAEVVDEQLQTNRTALAAQTSAVAKNFVKRIDDVKDDSGLDRRRALLQEVEVFRHNRKDTEYEELSAVLAKAVWLTVLALALVVALGVLFDRESYFLLGAAGGLISRLLPMRTRRPRSSEWGAAWSTLILSPVAGALAGWLGVLIVVALASEPFEVLGADFADLWKDASMPLGLVVAFLFGFSERLLDGVIGVAETEVSGKLTKKTGKAATDESEAQPAA